MTNILRSWLGARRSPQSETGPSLLSSMPGQFRDLENLFDKSFKAARVGIWECTLPDETLRWTDTVFELFGLEPQADINRADIVALYTPQSRDELKRVRDRALAEGTDFTLDAEIVTARGTPRWIRITAIVETVDGRPVRLFGMKQDITAEKAMLEQVRRLTEVDSLTGLASRSRFETVFDQLFAEQHSSRHALLLVDLDGFKAVNDTLGHQEGDLYLKQTGQRLLEAVPGALLRARLGGDEFAVIHPFESPEELHDLAARIVDHLDDGHVLSRQGLKVSSSVGVAPIHVDSTSKAIFSRADRALYAAKSAGKRGFRVDLGL